MEWVKVKNWLSVRQYLLLKSGPFFPWTACLELKFFTHLLYLWNRIGSDITPLKNYSVLSFKDISLSRASLFYQEYELVMKQQQ